MTRKDRFLPAQESIRSFSGVKETILVISAQAGIHLYVAPPSFLRKQESIRSFSGVKKTIIAFLESNH